MTNQKQMTVVFPDEEERNRRVKEINALCIEAGITSTFIHPVSNKVVNRPNTPSRAGLIRWIADHANLFKLLFEAVKISPTLTRVALREISEMEAEANK